MAERRGVKPESIVIDPGIGFGKIQEQNLELIAKLDQLVDAFSDVADSNGNVEEIFHRSCTSQTSRERQHQQTKDCTERSLQL